MPHVLHALFCDLNAHTTDRHAAYVPLAFIVTVTQSKVQVSVVEMIYSDPQVVIKC